jgi:hypothetical protein
MAPNYGDAYGGYADAQGGRGPYLFEFRAYFILFSGMPFGIEGADLGKYILGYGPGQLPGRLAAGKRSSAVTGKIARASSLDEEFGQSRTTGAGYGLI